MRLQDRCDSFALKNDLAGNQDVRQEAFVELQALVRHRASHLPSVVNARALKLAAQTTLMH
jgi:hypothetical protein